MHGLRAFVGLTSVIAIFALNTPAHANLNSDCVQLDFKSWETRVQGEVERIDVVLDRKLAGHQHLGNHQTVKLKVLSESHAEVITAESLVSVRRKYISVVVPKIGLSSNQDLEISVCKSS